jgi:hypothetical protein
MTAIAALTLADGQATPVNKTFSPVNIDQSGVARWADRSGGIALGYPSVTFSSRAPTKGSRSYKVNAKVVVPVLEQTSASTATGIQPAPTLSYSLLANVEFVIPERSTLQNRKDLLAYLRNYLANAVITSGVQDFESVY